MTKTIHETVTITEKVEVYEGESRCCVAVFVLYHFFILPAICYIYISINHLYICLYVVTIKKQIFMRMFSLCRFRKGCKEKDRKRGRRKG